MPDKVELEGQAYLNGQRKKLWVSVNSINQWMEDGMADGVIILSITVAGPVKTGSSYRATLKGRDSKGGLWVAWAFGDTVEELHNAIARQGAERGFTWREDKPFPEGGGKGS